MVTRYSMICLFANHVMGRWKLLTNSRGVGVDGVNRQVAARLYEYDEEEINERP